MKTRNTHLSPAVVRLLSLIVIITVATLQAQTKPTPPSATRDESSNEEAVLLSPFTVSTTEDRGYETHETISSTRLKTVNMFVGSAISEVNQQLMQDLAIFSVKDVIDYTTNAVAYDNGRTSSISDTQSNAAITSSNMYTIRGGLTGSTARDFVTTRVSTDAYNIERISVQRGPNAILFGLGGPQGIVNVTSSQAEMKNSVQLGFRFDNWGSWREDLKINRQIIKNKLALLISNMEENSRNNRKPSDKKHDRITGSVTIRPFPSTTLRATFEHAHLNDLAPRPWPVQDGLSAWIAAGSKELPPELQNGGALFASSFAPLTAAQNAQKPALAAQATALGFQLPTRGAFALPMKIFNSAGDMPMPWINDLGLMVTRYNKGVGVAALQNSTLLNSPIPYTANVQAYGQGLNILFGSQNLVAEQAIGKHLFIQGTVNRQYSRFLTNNINGSLYTQLMLDKNPTLLTIDNRIITNPNYNRYMLISALPSVITHRYFDEAKVLQATYQYDFNEGRTGLLARILGHHNLTALRQRTQFRDNARNESLTNASPFALQGVTPQLPANTFTAVNGAGSDPLQIITYIDPAKPSSWALPDFYTKFGPYKSVFAGGELPPTDPSGISPFWRVSNSTKSLQTINSQVLVWQGYFWGDRIVPTLGFRKDVADNRSLASGTTTYKGFTGWVVDSSGVDIYHGDALHPLTYNQQIGYTRTMGLIVYPLRLVGVYFNQSSNYSSVGTSANVNQFGNRLPPSGAVGRDWGVKLPLWQGKLFVTLNRYTVKQKDVANVALRNGFGGQINPNTALYRMSEDLYSQTADPKFLTYPWINNAQQNWSGTNDGWMKGYEMSATANPTRNWRISVNAAKSFSASSNFGKTEQLWHDTQLAYLEKNYPQRLDILTGKVGARGVVESVRQDFEDYQTSIKQSLTLAGRRDSRQPEWTGNLVTAYDFTTGRWKNFGIGGSFRYRSKTTIGYAYLPNSTTLFNANAPFYGPSRNPIGLFMSYKFRLKSGIRGTVQLNADSINFNSHLYPYLATDDGTGHPVIVTYAVGQDTTWALTFRFDL